MDEPIVDSARGLPVPALRAYVASYTGYWMEGIGRGTHQGLPSGFLTLVVSIVTFALERTNVLLGAVHLLLFLAYLMLIFAN